MIRSENRSLCFFCLIIITLYYEAYLRESGDLLLFPCVHVRNTETLGLAAAWKPSLLEYLRSVCPSARYGAQQNSPESKQPPSSCYKSWSAFPLRDRERKRTKSLCVRTVCLGFFFFLRFDLFSLILSAGPLIFSTWFLSVSANQYKAHSNLHCHSAVLCSACILCGLCQTPSSWTPSTPIVPHVYSGKLYTLFRYSSLFFGQI